MRIIGHAVAVILLVANMAHGTLGASLIDTKRKRNRAELYRVDSDGQNHDTATHEDDLNLNSLWDEGEDFHLDERILEERFMQILSMSMPTETTVPSLSPVPSMISDECLDGTTREDYLLGLLEPITPRDTLLDPTTPQGQAYAFINEDEDLDVCTYPTIQQRYALSTLYYATGGDDWNENEFWVEFGVDECEWFNVTCGPGEENTIVALHLESNNLQGFLPNEISALYTIASIILFDNRIISTIPTGIGNLTRLELLDIEACNFTDSLFTEDVLKLTELVALRASFNEFNNSIPAEISSLSHLKQLWAADNQLSGELPTQMAQLTSLETLFLYENSLRGNIISGYGSFTNLTQLRLYDNSFGGEIPADLYEATTLTVLRLDRNFMTGQISSAIGNLVNLEDFRLNDQFAPGFSGSIPLQIGSNSLLRNFVINNNDFSGPFPDVFGSYTDLTFFDISNNRFDGTIPSGLFLITALQNAYFSNNTFTGTIPNTFATPPDLLDLYLDGNALTGTIPVIPPNTFVSLTELLFERNNLAGTMPESICALREGDNPTLVALQSDCAGDPPEVVCPFPDCCTRCFSDDTQAPPAL